MKQRVLITGGQGFVGKALAIGSLAHGFKVRVSSRRKLPATDIRFESAQIGDLGPSTDWLAALQGVDAVVHCAARAHVLNDTASDPLEAFRAVNVVGTVNLAEQALRAGIRRFIFISSIGVNGNQTFCHAFSEVDVLEPQEPYAISKLEAEVALRNLFSGSQTQLVIVRPPLVYGPNPPGNFRRLLKLAASGLPLPLGAIHNKRSFVALGNLVDLILTCIDHPAAANQTFLVSDGEDISTTQLLRRMGDALGKPAWLLPVPVWMLEAGAALLGKRDLSQRLCGNLQVNISKAKDLLGWSPPVSVDEGLRVTAEHYFAGLLK